MKFVILLFVLIFANATWASCPQLQGEYTCKPNYFKIKQVEENGIHFYKIDGVTYRSDGSETFSYAYTSVGTLVTIKAVSVCSDKKLIQVVDKTIDGNELPSFVSKYIWSIDKFGDLKLDSDVNAGDFGKYKSIVNCERTYSD